MKKLLKTSPTLLVIVLGLILSGCVNLDQKTTLNSNGSGSMNIKYWTKTTNILGDEIGNFGFSENKVKNNFSSSVTSSSNINIEKDATTDSLTIVNLNVKFSDINKISQANAFSNVVTSWEKNGEEYVFKYTILQDTANAKQFGMSDYTLHYEFEFPGEVLSANGKKSGNKAAWDFTVADLVKNVDFIATVKAGN